MTVLFFSDFSALDAGTSLNALAVYMFGLEAAHSWWNPTNDAVEWGFPF
jgi:hypothetical protein